MGGTEWLRGLVIEQGVSMLGHQVRSLLGLKVIIKLQLFTYVQASATHRETLITKIHYRKW